MTRTASLSTHGLPVWLGQVTMTLAVNVPAVEYTCVTVGTVVVTVGEPSPKFHVYVQPLVAGTSVTVKTAVAVAGTVPDPAQPSTTTVTSPIVGHGAGGLQRSGTLVFASHSPSVQVAVTAIGLSHAQSTFELNVANQFPALSIGTRILVGVPPQSIVTFSSPVVHPVAVPDTSIDVGAVALEGRIPTTLPIVIVQAMALEIAPSGVLREHAFSGNSGKCAGDALVI
jgi:hypothetical protein